MKTTELKAGFQSGKYAELLKDIYIDESVLEYQKERYVKAIESFEELFGVKDVEIYSAPGRSEIGGNHTDHQCGRVLAASINLDAIAIVAKKESGIVLKSEGYPMINVSLADLLPKKEEEGTSAGLIRGVAARLKEEGYPVVLDILGGYEDNYKEQIDEYVNNGIVNYYGYQSDVRPFIEKAHCFVLPSYHEGMANTLLENASMGRPLITSNIHGCLEAIHDNGYLCKVKDQEDLYKKMKEFLELNHSERVQMGFNSRKHVEEVFDKRKVVEKTMKGVGL